MRFLLAGMLIICVAGFLATSGTVTLQAGALHMNVAALKHTVPVLIALAAPMLTMAVVLMVTMTIGRPTARNRARGGTRHARRR
jgi:hypothetical protein